ncbi:MAG: copper resistance protein CopC [Caldilineaceae bacterium]
MRIGLPRATLIGIGGLLVLGALLSWGAVADAHALLVRSEPAAGAELTTPPATIDLWFSEPLEPAFSLAYLVDAQGNEFGRGASTVDAANTLHLTVTLTELPPGIYTVVYRNLSQADGHEWVGSFPLTLLHPDGSRPTGAAVETVGKELPTPVKTLSRWLALLGAMLATGVIGFQQPAPASPQAAHQDDLVARIEQQGRVLLVVGVGLLFVGSWLQVLAQLRTLGGGERTGGVTLDLFFQTRAGALLVARQLVAGALLFLTIVAAGFAGKLRRAGQWLALLLSLALLATFSIGSHAAAVVGSGWAILGDFVHLTAAALWLGGLSLLALLLRPWIKQPAGDVELLHQLIRRFSLLATLAVFVLIVTGLFSSLVQLPSVADLWHTTYGRLLLLKVLLVGVALWLALFNHRFVRSTTASSGQVGSPLGADDTVDAPTLPGRLPSAYRAFARQVWRETGVGVGLMLVVALLVQTPVPPSATARAWEATGSPNAPPPATSFFETILQADDLTIHLQISPNQVGDNRYTTHLYHADGSPIGAVQLVRLTFTHQTADLGQASLELTSQGGDLFAGAGAYQNRAGPWDVAVYVRRRGLDDLLTTTTVNVPPPVVGAPRTSWQNPIATLPPGVVIGGVLAALLLLPLVWRRARVPTPS